MDASSIEIATFSSGDYLFHENEEGFFFFIIQEGQVEVFKTREDRGKVPLAIVGPGSALGEFAMIDRQPRSATARALTDVRAAKISEEVYQHLLIELPDWAVAVMRALVERCRHTNDLIRRHGLVDQKMLTEIEALQLDSSSSIGSSPFLTATGKGDDL